MAKIEGSRERIKDPVAENVGGEPAGFGLRVARARYDFAADGGAIGDINLLSSADIPANAVILGGYLDVITSPTSAANTATIALKAEAANDVVAAAVVSGAPWSTTGFKSIVPSFAGANAIRASVARNIVASIAVQALTAGKFDVILFYIAAPR